MKYIFCALIKISSTTPRKLNIFKLYRDIGVLITSLLWPGALWSSFAIHPPHIVKYHHLHPSVFTIHPIEWTITTLHPAQHSPFIHPIEWTITTRFPSAFTIHSWRGMNYHLALHIKTHAPLIHSGKIANSLRQSRPCALVSDCFTAEQKLYSRHW